MIYIAICDDEKYMLDEIAKMVSKFFRNKKIEITILKFLSGRELLKYKKTIDIVFLDIQMKEIDGMATAKVLREQNYRGFLIFITILQEMVFQSFEVQAYDYLIKPIEEAHFQKTMERLFCSIRSSSGNNLFIQKGNECRIISFDDIIFCEIINRKIYLHLRSKEVMDYYDRMENLEKKLDGRFYKCHRSYLINLKYLKSYKNGMAYLEGEEMIPVSRLRSKEFSNVILQYMRECKG